LKAGFINYSNSYPFLSAIEEKDIEGLVIESHIPATLNKKLSLGELDTSAVSLFEFLKNEDQYLLMPNWCINSRGHVRSVLLFSKFHFSELNHKRILLCSESATSNNLLKLLLAHENITPSELKVKTPEDTPNQWDAILLIGDPALKFDSANHPHITDLAQAWVDWTKGPVVFAVQAIRKDAFDGNQLILKTISNTLETVQNKIKNNLDLVCQDLKQAFPQMETDFIDYFKCLDFQLDSACLEAIHRYASESIKINTLEKKPQLNFAEL